MNPASNMSSTNIHLSQFVSSEEVPNPIPTPVPSPPPEVINVRNVSVDMVTNSHQRDLKEGDNDKVRLALLEYMVSKSNSNESSTSSSHLQTSQSATGESIDSGNKYTSTEIREALTEFMSTKTELKESEYTQNRQPSNSVSEPALSAPLISGLATTVHTLTESSITAMHTLEGTSRTESASASHLEDSKEPLPKNKDVRPKVLTSKAKIKKNIFVSINDLFHRKKEVEIEIEEERRQAHVSNITKLLEFLFVLPHAFETEGIFRRSADTRMLNKASGNMQEFMKTIKQESVEPSLDAILIADLIKRELELSLSDEERTELFNASETVIETLVGNINDWGFLPLPIFSMLQICTFVLEKKEMNKMPAYNLAVVFQPRIFPVVDLGKIEDSKIIMKMIGLQTKWLESMIEKWYETQKKNPEEVDGAEAPSL